MAVTDGELAARGLPELAYVDNKERRYHPDASVIAIKRGESGFWPITVKASADELNASEGVTAEQREAMLAGSMFGWNTPGADPKSAIAIKMARRGTVR